MPTRKDDDTETTATERTETVKRERYVETSHPGPNPRSETPDQFDKRIAKEQEELAARQQAERDQRNQ